MADRFEDLRTFTTIIAAGGINAAAAELGIAKSAVSRRLSDLEKRLEVNLVERSGHRLEPTALGAEYARRARALLASLDDLDTSLSSGGDRANASISAPSALIRHVLTPAIAASSLAGSGMLIRMSETYGDDADVMIGVPDHRRREGRRLLTTSLVIVSSPDHIKRHGRPENERDLDVHAAILVGGAAAEWLVGDRRRPTAKVAIVTSDVDAAAAAASAGLGMAQLPDYVVADALADGRLIQVLAQETPPPSPVEARIGANAGIEAGRLIDALADAITAVLTSTGRGHKAGDEA